MKLTKNTRSNQNNNEIEIIGAASSGREMIKLSEQITQTHYCLSRVMQYVPQSHAASVSLGLRPMQPVRCPCVQHTPPSRPCYNILSNVNYFQHLLKATKGSDPRQMAGTINEVKFAPGWNHVQIYCT